MREKYWGSHNLYTFRWHSLKYLLSLVMGDLWVSWYCGFLQCIQVFHCDPMMVPWFSQHPLGMFHGERTGPAFGKRFWGRSGKDLGPAGRTAQNGREGMSLHSGFSKEKEAMPMEMEVVLTLPQWAKEEPDLSKDREPCRTSTHSSCRDWL